MFAEILAIIRDVSPITLTIAVLVYFLNRSIDANSNDDKSYAELLARHLDLEKKFTVCREELAKEKGDKALSEQAQSYAVAEYLDDTHNYTAEIADLEDRLREASETIIILQNTVKQLKALQIATELPSEMNESQKEYNQKDEQ